VGSDAGTCLIETGSQDDPRAALHETDYTDLEGTECTAWPADDDTAHRSFGVR